MSTYNRTRHAELLLEKNASQPPSFSVHLHPEHWTLNNVSTKFLYNTQISCLLDDIRAHRIPVDFLDLFDAVKVPFYDGCMIVELLDYRPQQRNNQAALDKPAKTRVVLHPNGETLFADICSLNRKAGGKWTDRDALEVESRLLLATSPPLCLAPDPHLTRVVNHVLRVSTPTVPISLKRKAAAMDPEEDSIEKARRSKIMQFMSPRPSRTHPQGYRILDAIQESRQLRNNKPPTPSVPSAEPAPPPPPPNNNMVPAPYPASVEKLKKQNRPGTPKTMFANGSPHTSANQTPSPTHMFANMPPAPATAADAAKRASTPLQHQYAPSPPSASQPQPHPPPPQIQPNTQQPRPPSAVPAFQPSIPNAQFLNPPPPGRNPSGQGKPPHPAKPGQPGPPQSAAAAANAQQLYYAQQQQQALVIQQQRLLVQQQQQHQQQSQQSQTPQQPPQPPQPNGRSTPRPVMTNGQANMAAAMAASRGNSLAPSNQQRVATRSPAASSQPPNPNSQMSVHNPPPQLNFSYHTPPRLRPNLAANGNTASPRPPPNALPPHLAAAAAASRASPSPTPASNAASAVDGGQPISMPPSQQQQSSAQPQQQQQQQQQQYQMYYQNMYMQSAAAAGRLPNGYPPNGWPMMVPGARNVNGVNGVNGMTGGPNGHGHGHGHPGMGGVGGMGAMGMQPGMIPGGQHHALPQHHQVPVGGGGKGQPGLPGR
ncbi:Spt20 family-domain-containing protein [Favolaschia claudopus]|uniref:Spt20 family-domain-containing protein n=1 Tax=Favolaschia claudopus TaxID=2862362 RepID=A0AAW0BXD2_9AGAR